MFAGGFEPLIWRYDCNTHSTRVLAIPELPLLADGNRTKGQIFFFKLQIAHTYATKTLHRVMSLVCDALLPQTFFAQIPIVIWGIFALHRHIVIVICVGTRNLCTERNDLNEHSSDHMILSLVHLSCPGMFPCLCQH